METDGQRIPSRLALLVWVLLTAGVLVAAVDAMLPPASWIVLALVHALAMALGRVGLWKAGFQPPNERIVQMAAAVALSAAILTLLLYAPHLLIFMVNGVAGVVAGAVSVRRIKM
ncbi:MAG TPA: hypothetical protein VFH47_07010 [Candidatus Thermoplasmatota archaeon]|nr:hypothetical protein [Candidatus Thermoplasmatota archaeon]